MTQLTLGNLNFINKKKRLRREIFLEEMNKAIPWKRLLQAIHQHYQENKGNGRPSYSTELMLRIYFLQQWFQLSDEGMEEALYDTHSLRAFAGIELGDGTIPDENTILNFRHMLERPQPPFPLLGTSEIQLRARPCRATREMLKNHARAKLGQGFLGVSLVLVSNFLSFGR